MNQTNNHIRTGTLAGIILLAAASRLAMPTLFGHASNFSPIGAMALFGGAYFGKNWKGFAIPFFALWVSDWFVNYIHLGEFTMFYPGFYWQYGSFALIVLLGALAVKKVKPLRVFGASISASVLFFTVSNFGVWATGLLYPMTGTGLVACYVAGIPFLWQTLASDLLFSSVLFGGFELAKWRFPALIKAQV